MERFIYLFIKMDDLYLLDCKEMRLDSKGNFDIAYSAVMGSGLNACLRKFIVFSPAVWLCQFNGRQMIYQSLKKFTAFTESTFKEHDNLSPDHSSYSFPMKSGHIPGRIPGKISSSFTGFTADQWKNWTLVYSLFALKGILPEEHLQCWRFFVLACKTLGKRVLTGNDIEIGDKYLMQFCKTFETLYGKDLVTPNMHLHGNLKECLLDYGPFHSFWCFSFERFNGILGSYHTNNRSIEIQLMRKFLMQTKVKDFSYPEKYQDSFMEFFDTYQSSGSVKVTQEPIEQYLSLQEHRDVSVQHLNCCDWIAGKNCIFLMSTPKDGILDSEDLSALRSVYQELLGFDDRTIIDMPHTITEFKAVKVGTVSYGSLECQTSRNATVLANWTGPDGSLACTTGCNDTRLTSSNV